MQASQRDDDPLRELRDVVAALNVRPLVHDDVIEFILAERGERARRDGNHRRAEPEHGGGPDVIRHAERAARPPSATESHAFKSASRDAGNGRRELPLMRATSAHRVRSPDTIV